MELYIKDELNILKKLIEEIGEKNKFKETLESIDNCLKIIDTENND